MKLEKNQDAKERRLAYQLVSNLIQQSNALYLDSPSKHSNGCFYTYIPGGASLRLDLSPANSVSATIQIGENNSYDTPTCLSMYLGQCHEFPELRDLLFSKLEQSLNGAPDHELAPFVLDLLQKSTHWEHNSSPSSQRLFFSTKVYLQDKKLQINFLMESLLQEDRDANLALNTTGGALFPYIAKILIYDLPQNEKLKALQDTLNALEQSANGSAEEKQLAKLHQEIIKIEAQHKDCIANFSMCFSMDQIQSFPMLKNTLKSAAKTNSSTYDLVSQWIDAINVHAPQTAALMQKNHLEHLSTQPQKLSTAARRRL